MLAFHVRSSRVVVLQHIVAGNAASLSGDQDATLRAMVAYGDGLLAITQRAGATDIARAQGEVTWSVATILKLAS